MKKNMWLRVVAVWAGIMAVETVHGILRTWLLEPAIGAFRARQLSVFTASVLIFAITWATARWIGAGSERAVLNIGGLWVAMTLGFEMALGWAMGLSWGRMLEDYNVARGGLMPLGLLFMSFAPWLAMRGQRRLAAARYYPVAWRLPSFLHRASGSHLYLRTQHAVREQLTGANSVSS